MNMESVSKKVSWALAGAIVLLVLSQQHALNRSRENERSADRELVKLGLENSALRQRVSNNLWREVVP